MTRFKTDNRPIVCTRRGVHEVRSNAIIVSIKNTTRVLHNFSLIISPLVQVGRFTTLGDKHDALWISYLVYTTIPFLRVGHDYTRTRTEIHAKTHTHRQTHTHRIPPQFPAGPQPRRSASHGTVEGFKLICPGVVWFLGWMFYWHQDFAALDTPAMVPNVHVVETKGSDRPDTQLSVSIPTTARPARHRYAIPCPPPRLPK